MLGPRLSGLRRRYQAAFHYGRGSRCDLKSRDTVAKDLCILVQPLSKSNGVVLIGR